MRGGDIYHIECRLFVVTLRMVHSRIYILSCLAAIIILPLLLSARSEKIHITDNVNASDIAACDTAVDKTMAQYRHISKTDFKPYQFDNGDDYVQCERFRIVDNTGKIGYANPQGYIVIEPRYAFGFPFENGMAKVTDTGQIKEVESSNGEYHYWDSDDWYYIDLMGNRIDSR